MDITSLTHRLDRTIDIEARPQTVFSFFTDSDRWASWWGAGSVIEPTAGGRMFIRHPNGVEASGEVVEVEPPDRIVFTYGFASGQPMAPGSSRVTIRLQPIAFGTRLQLTHEFAEPTTREDHVQGWRYQLSLFANVVADALHRDSVRLIDDWFAAWAEPDAAALERRLAAVAVENVRFRDRYSLLTGIADLVPHIAAAQRFLPGMLLARRGDARHCQGRFLAEWVAARSDGQEWAAGTNVFTVGADGLIEDVVGFWNPQKAK
jgi:uncharacterized protein YndB with AHSA1/START domain